MKRMQQVYLILLALFHVGHGAQTQAQLRRVAEEQLQDNAPPVESGIARIRGGFGIDTPFSWLGVFDDLIVCGAVLVHADIVVTTANCVDDGFPKAVRIGSLERNTSGTVSNVNNGVIHPDWSGDPTQGADIAVLRLESLLTNTVAIVNDDPQVPLNDDDELFMAGFGMVSDTDFPDRLQGLFLDNVENCFERAPPVYNPQFNFCGDATPAFGTCPGDSGTPILVPGTRLVVGLNSFSDRGCEMQTVDVYTRISTYSLWIQEQVCNLSAQPPAICEELNPEFCLFESILNWVTGFFGL